MPVSRGAVTVWPAAAALHSVSSNKGWEMGTLLACLLACFHSKSAAEPLDPSSALQRLGAISHAILKKNRIGGPIKILVKNAKAKQRPHHHLCKPATVASADATVAGLQSTIP